MITQTTLSDFIERCWNLVGVGADAIVCWPWKGSVNGAGYGQIEWNNKGYRANRLIYAFTHAAIPFGLVVRHTCDNPICVNPSHLVLGTPKDNCMDCKDRKRDRKAIGTRNGRAKLNPEAVVDIRKRHASGTASYRDLAEHYGVAYSQIYFAVKRKQWAHVL